MLPSACQVSATDAQSPSHEATAADLSAMIRHAAHLLPAQGPITAFVHHNTLHAWEHLPFDEAVVQGGRVAGGQPYLSEDEYRRLLASERIQLEDLEDVLLETLDNHADGLIGRLGTRFCVRLAMLQHPLRLVPDAELQWLIAESDALRRFQAETPGNLRQRMIADTRHWVMREVSPGVGAAESADRRLHDRLAGLLERFGAETIDRWNDATWEAFSLQLLWRICHQGVHGLAGRAWSVAPPPRHRDLLYEASGADSDALVHDVLIPFCAAFLDQGLAHWPLPDREQGFFRCFMALFGQQLAPTQRWLQGLGNELKRINSLRISPVDSISESLDELGVAPDERENYLAHTLLALGGWAGMLWQVETRGDRVAHPAPAGTLVEYVAVRLILERLAVAHVAQTALGFRGTLRQLWAMPEAHAARRRHLETDQRAFLVFQLAQALGWTPEALHHLSKSEWVRLIDELEGFGSLERRRVYQAAYERHYLRRLLHALSARPVTAPRTRPGRPSFQVVCCIDDREESFRRHLEEIEPACETFGFAGFFGVAMYYRGAADAYYRPLCPVVVQPRHYVCEEVPYTFEESHRRRAEARRVLGAVSHRWQLESRTLLGGVFTSLLGALASGPLVARILFPRATAQWQRMFGRFVHPPPASQLRLQRTAPMPGPVGDEIGYSINEMADIVAGMLRGMGLTSGFSRLVIIVGHGSSSLNNPHESAYNCGACAGNRGGPNARAAAHMANLPRVRQRLAELQLPIPDDTHFLAAFHNTCDDAVEYFDLDQLPPTHRDDLEQARRCIDDARQRNAHERCRRFESAPLSLTPGEALRHVEGRAEDLSQTRPEYNHATNAATIVGRRERTRGLFLDRRVFLASYDPTQDDEEGSTLTRILQAVVPVCAGISLEYYFSRVDPNVWGCGSKLPHNVAALLGVMIGAASDLRPGLSTQMTEIHEPMRPMFVVETTPDRLRQILDRQPAMRQLCLNQWVYLATLDPESQQIHLLRGEAFEPYHGNGGALPRARSSSAWYRGWRDHLEIAALEDAADLPAPRAAGREGA